MNPSIRLGKRNRLEVLREVDFGMYLDAGEVGDVLLPRRYVPEGTRPGDIVDVFLYLDGDERLIATTETPLVEVGQFACLKVNWTNQYGAFLDWGLMKDLFCPFHEQPTRMQQGQSYVIYCYIDPKSYRIVASAKVDKFLVYDNPPYHSGDSVEALVYDTTNLGVKVVVDNRYSGLLFQNEIFQTVYHGDRLQAFVKQVREDGKIDLKLQKYFGKRRITDFSHQLLEYLQSAPGGFCPLHDKSAAEDIYQQFRVSKKTFKRGVGDLYKQHLIQLLPDGIRLVASPRSAELRVEADPS